MSTTADEARNVLRRAIRSDVYQAGESLPSSRDLAQQFGINRNTANKIYRELIDEGLLESVPNRPPRVVISSSTPTDGDLSANLRAALWPLLHEARILRISESKIREMVSRGVDEFFHTYTPPRVILTECNEHDVQRYTNELSAALGCDVHPVLLPEIKNRFADVDLVVAPHFHVNEARDALEASNDKVLGLLLVPDAADVSLLVSKMNHGPLGVVARNPDSLDRLRSVLRFYLGFPTLLATLDDPEGIARVIEGAEHIACTVQCSAALDNAGAGAKTVPVRYHIDPVSIEALRQRLVAIQDGRSAAMTGNST